MAARGDGNCDGIEVNAEQVNRGMAWVYRHAKDQVSSFSNPLLHPGNGAGIALCRNCLDSLCLS